MVAAMARAPAACYKSGGFPMDKSDGSVHPAKLFIGGITRHTTTKQLRDHFSRYGRVLDCVAMRQPDGRPRGFGYVTLDSPAAADRCLAEPQVVDGRVVDMKRAVPEGSGSPIASAVGTPLAADCAHAHGADTLLGISLRAPPPSLYEWPDSAMSRIGGGSYFGTAPHLGSVLMPDIGPSSPLAGERLWPWGSPRTPEEAHHADGALDCVELLSRRCPAPPATLMGTLPSQTLAGAGALSCDATRLDSVDLLVGGGHMASALGDQSPMATPAAALAGALSPTAPEFVPMCSREKADEKKPLTAAETQQKARTALGEITNIVAGSPKDGIKQLSSLKGDLLGAKPLTSGGGLGGISGGVGGISRGLEPLCTPAGKQTASKFEVLDDGFAQDPEDSEEPLEDSEESPKESEEPAAAETVGASGESTPPAPTSEEPLPSIGSAEHALGTCRRCNFYPKGRCQNGKDCTFCHFPHDKRKPSRQEKRERRAKWLAEHQGQAFDADDFDEDEDEDSEDGAPQVVAYSVLPGMPPTRAPKLPSPLALPTTCGFEAAAPGAPRLPPGLPPPPPQRPSLELWQPEEEISPQQFEVAFSPYGTPLQALQSLTPSARMPPILATVPRSAASSLATSLAPSPVNASNADKKASFPTECQVLAEAQGARSAPPTPASCTVGTQCTIGTQTEDAEDKQQPEVSPSAAGEADQRGTKSRSRRIWPRNELLQLRHLGSEPLKTSGEGCGSGSAAAVLFRTAARLDSKDGLC